MPTNNQLIRNPRKSKKKKTSKLALKTTWNSLKKRHFISKSPQKWATCKKIMVLKPRKPNSANRPCARVILKSKKEITVYIPGEKHNLREYSSVLIKGGGAKDLPGVKYEVVRGKGDCEGVVNRNQGRSLYGAKKKSKDKK